MNNSNTKKTRLFKVATFFMTLVLCIGALELMVRIFNPQSDERWTDLFFNVDPIMGMAGVPNLKGTNASPSFKTQVFHNEDGFRDVTHSKTNLSNKFRIVNLGDSFTWGTGVENDEIYMKKLEELNPNIETINLGGPGGAPPGELTVHLLHGLRYEHDLVMLGFFMGNDLVMYQPTEGTTPPQWGYDSEGTYRWIGKVPTPEENEKNRIAMEEWHSPNKYKTWDKQLHYWLIRNFQFYTFIDNIQDQFGDRIKSSPWFIKAGKALGIESKHGLGFLNICLKPEQPAVTKRWSYMEETLKTIRDVVEGTSAKLYIVFIPHVVQTSDEIYTQALNRLSESKDNFDIEMPNRKLTQILDRLEIAHLDLAPGMTKETLKKGPLYFRRDPHWNKEGHAVAARLIHEDMAKRGWVQKTNH